MSSPEGSWDEARQTYERKKRHRIIAAGRSFDPSLVLLKIEDVEPIAECDCDNPNDHPIFQTPFGMYCGYVLVLRLARLRVQGMFTRVEPIEILYLIYKWRVDEIRM